MTADVPPADTEFSKDLMRCGNGGVSAHCVDVRLFKV
jgi:hypothetical protein